MVAGISWGKRRLVRESVGRQIESLVRKYRCLRCHRVWSLTKRKKRQRWSHRFVREAVKTFIDGVSLRNLARRAHLGKDTIHRWVIAFGTNCRSPAEVATSLGLVHTNRWSGMLYLDGKWLTRRAVLLLAVDARTLDIVAWRWAEDETEEEYTKLIDQVEACGYQVKVVVSDGEPAILSLTQPKKTRVRLGTQRYPRPGIPPVIPKRARLSGVPHQWCVVHAFREGRMILTGVAKPRKEFLLGLLAKVLFTKTPGGAYRAKKRFIREIVFRYPPEMQLAGFLLGHWNLLTTHHRVRVGGHKIPRDSNGVESVISFINARLKTTRGLKTPGTTSAICSLIILNYRFKPLDGAQKGWRWKKAPLSLAGAKIRGLDWLQFSQKPTSY